jgi:hypothetical protein
MATLVTGLVGDGETEGPSSFGRCTGFGYALVGDVGVSPALRTTSDRGPSYVRID